jgi:GT2 family glycosyltransferase
MNLGVDAASHDLVWLTVAHALPTTTQLLHGGTLHFRDETTVGAFSRVLPPNGNASLAERTWCIKARGQLRAPIEVTRAEPGTMGAASAVLRKRAWAELGRFDERYETGGEDTAFGAKALAAGYALRNEPLLAVHHSHGLGVMGKMKQARGYSRTARGPVALHREKLTGSKRHISFK